MDPTFVVLVSFMIFMGIAYRFGYRQAIGALDKQIAKIRQALEDASQAKEAAIQALNEERRHHEEILKEIEHITTGTEEQTLILRQQALLDINNMIAIRQNAAENMIKRMHISAIQNIQDEATAKTIAAFELLATKKLTLVQHQALNDMAIDQIANQFTTPRATQVRKSKRAVKMKARRYPD